MIPLVIKLHCAKQVVAHGVGEILIPYFLRTLYLCPKEPCRRDAQ
jgi:hypothetical protein